MVRILVFVLALIGTDTTVVAQEAARQGQLKTWRGNVVGQLSRHDGDTFWIGPAQVRLFGIDSPELSPICRSSEGDASCNTFAMDGLGDLIYQGATCEAVGDRMDRYNRWLVLCETHDRLDVGLEMIKQGWACAARKYLKRHSLKEAYVAAEIVANSEKRGLWGMGFNFPNMCQDQ